MSEKKMVSRIQFSEELSAHAKKMREDEVLRRDALDVLARADRYKWIHQTTWFGEPILNIPHDLFALQEIIYRTRPDFIIEIGVAWGGSLLYYSTLMEALGGKKIIGVDIYIPDDLRERIGSYGRLSERIELVAGSSVERGTVEIIRNIIGESKKVLVILDSHHTHDHVLKELNIYSEFISCGNYLICADTVVEDLPVQTHRKREWGPGNSPKTALNDFLALNSRFEIDYELENKLLFSCNPGGYIRAVRDSQ